MSLFVRLTLKESPQGVSHPTVNIAQLNILNPKMTFNDVDRFDKVGA